MTMRATLEFLLHEWIEVESLFRRPRFADHSRETVTSVLDSLRADSARENLCRSTARSILKSRASRVTPSFCRPVRSKHHRRTWVRGCLRPARTMNSAECNCLTWWRRWPMASSRKPASADPAAIC